MEMRGQLHAPVALPLERTTVLLPIELEAGCAPKLVWTVVEVRKSLAPTAIQTPDHPA
jgi:hypothetical protein